MGSIVINEGRKDLNLDLLWVAYLGSRGGVGVGLEGREKWGTHVKRME